MLIYRFRRNLWLVAAIIAADWIIAAWFGDTVVRWEIEQLRAAW